MSIRKNRRAVMAELLLLANPATIRTRLDGESLGIDFDTIAELRSWLHLAGLNDPDAVGVERTGTDSDGRTFRAMSAFPTWHGWDVYAHATEYADRGTVLEPETADKLSALAVTP